MDKIIVKLLMLLPVAAMGAWVFFLQCRKKLLRDYAMDRAVSGKAFLVSRVVAIVLTAVAAVAWAIVFLFFPDILSK